MDFERGVFVRQVEPRETGGTDRPYKVMVSAGETAGKDAGARFASAEEAKAWCYRYSMRELADIEKKPEPVEAASAAKKAAGCSAGDDAGAARFFGFFAVVFAAVNIFGGFLVTQRMLAMYKKKS